MYLLMDSQLNSIATVGGFFLAFLAAIGLPYLETQSRILLFLCLLLAVSVIAVTKNFYRFYCDNTTASPPRPIYVVDIHPSAEASTIVCTNAEDLKPYQLVAVYKIVRGAEQFIGVGFVLHVQEKLVQVSLRDTLQKVRPTEIRIDPVLFASHL